MEKEPKIKDESIAENTSHKVEKKPFFSKKMIIFGAIVFILQFIVFYFLTAMVILPLTSANEVDSQVPEQKVEDLQDNHLIFLVNDIIINPAGTNGTRFLLTTIGFEVRTTGLNGKVETGGEVEAAKVKSEIEEKEVEVRDILNSVLTSKNLDELADVKKRESLRNEIAQKVGETLKSDSLTKVYFSKFVIQ
jgi:flagellar basal body-associated protein FliL